MLYTAVQFFECILQSIYALEKVVLRRLNTNFLKLGMCCVVKLLHSIQNLHNVRLSAKDEKTLLADYLYLADYHVRIA